MTLLDFDFDFDLGVSMIVLGTFAKSAFFTIIVVSKNKRYPELYGWSFIETQM